MVTGNTYNSSRSHGGNNFVLQVGVFPSLSGLSLFFYLFFPVQWTTYVYLQFGYSLKRTKIR